MLPWFHFLVCVMAYISAVLFLFFICSRLGGFLLDDYECVRTGCSEIYSFMASKSSVCVMRPFQLERIFGRPFEYYFNGMIFLLDG